jgi:hypothetical protein
MKHQEGRGSQLPAMPERSSTSLTSALAAFFWSSRIMLTAVLSRGVLAQCRMDLIFSMFLADSSSWRELEARTSSSIFFFTFARSLNAL